MKLLTPREVKFRSRDRIYRESSWVPLIIGASFLGGSIGILYMVYKDVFPLFVVIPGGFIALFGLLFLNIFRKSLSPNNWYVALKPEGILFIKFRSHLNEHLPETDKQIASLALSEIQSVSITKRSQKSDGDRRTKYQFFTFLDIHTTCHDLGKLSERLQHEIKVKSKTKYSAYPVSVHGKIIRIQWSSSQSHIRPGIKTIIKDLTKYRVKKTSDKSEKVDLRSEVVQAQKNKEDAIIKLVQQGDKIDAIRLARKLYNYDRLRLKSLLISWKRTNPFEATLH